MTWVVGIAAVDRALLLGDVRVSHSGGEFLNWGLRKTYPVAANVAIGFAGDVYIGMDVVKMMQQRCDSLDPLASLEPGALASHVQKFLREEYLDRYSPKNREGGCEILVFGVSPTETVRYPNDAGAWTVKASYGWRFVAPQRPGDKPRVKRVVMDTYVEGDKCKTLAIGSGSAFAPYLSALERVLAVDPHTLLKFSESQPGSEATLITELITPTVTQWPMSGVSPDSAYVLLEPTGHHQAFNDWSMTHAHDGHSIVEVEDTWDGVLKRLAAIPTSPSTTATPIPEQISTELTISAPAGLANENLEQAKALLHRHGLRVELRADGPVGLAAAGLSWQEVTVHGEWVSLLAHLRETESVSGSPSLRDLVSELSSLISWPEVTAQTRIVFTDTATQASILLSAKQEDDEYWAQLLTLDPSAFRGQEVYWYEEAREWRGHSSARTEEADDYITLSG